jgi:hypothetical protein
MPISTGCDYWMLINNSNKPSVMIAEGYSQGERLTVLNEKDWLNINTTVNELR